MTAICLLGSATALAGCTSVQWTDRDGRLRVVGWARVDALESEQPATHVVAPALALRLVPGLVGYSLGWRETVLFQSADSAGDLETVAFADRCYGVAIDLGRVIIGTEHRFGVFQPDSQRSVIQQIEYSESGDFPTRMRRLEVR